MPKFLGRWIIGLGLVLIGLQSCSVSKPGWTPNTLYSPREMQRDYQVFRNVLEESHPALYWYTPKDSMDYFFDWGFRQLTDSMTEPQFRSVLSYVIAKVKCGHTSTRYSRRFLHFLDTARLPQFPISIKVLENDTVLLNNTLRRSTVALPRGTQLTSLNGVPMMRLVDSLVQHIPVDGLNQHYLYQTISNRGALGGWLRLVAGYSPRYQLGYIDSTGNEQQYSFSLVEPPKKDSTKRINLPSIKEKLRRREQRLNNLDLGRSLQLDTALSTGYMIVNTFNNKYRLRSFFRNSFKALKRYNIEHLVIDIRSNGGGNVAHSTYLTRKLIDHPFKLADSLYAVKRKSKYGRYVQYNGVTGLFMHAITRRKNDGLYHFGYFERKMFKPAQQKHFDGRVYILTGPNSFSAAALFAGSMKGQSNVTLIGEETGGGAYGNSAWFIPEVRLPETGIRFRLPKFRLVIDKDAPKTGRGVLPDIEVKATVQSVVENRDGKIEAVRELIQRTKG